MKLILASSSPRRQSLLREAGFEFEIYPANIDEEAYPPTMPPAEIAQFLATAKAQTVANLFPDAVVLGSDTIVHHWNQLLGKPTGPEDARRILGILSGSRHRVVTGVAVVCLARNFRSVASMGSIVQMRRLTPNEIDRYVAGGQWEGKAGGYGIQDNDPFVIDLSGSPTNVVGLPMELAVELLASAGIFPKHRSGPTDTISKP